MRVFDFKKKKIVFQEAKWDKDDIFETKNIEEKLKKRDDKIKKREKKKDQIKQFSK